MRSITRAEVMKVVERKLVALAAAGSISEKDISDSKLPRAVILPMLRGSVRGLYLVDASRMPAALAAARKLISGEPTSGEVVKNMIAKPRSLAEINELRRKRTIAD